MKQRYEKRRTPDPSFFASFQVPLIAEILFLLRVGLEGRIVHDRGADHDRGVGTDQDTEAERHGKTPDRFSAEERDGEHREEGRHGGVDGTGQGCVQGTVDGVLEIILRVQALHFADTVEDDHVVVDCVTDDRKDRRDERLVDVEVERQDAREQGEEADDDDRGMGEGDHAAETPGPALETERDVGEDDDEGDDDGDDSVALHVVRDGRTHLVGGNDAVRVVERGGELRERHAAVGEERLQRSVNLVLDLAVDLGRLVLDLVGGGDLHLGGAAELLDLDGSFVKDGGDCGTDGLGRLRLVEADHIGAAALEIDTVGEALEADRGDRDDDESAGDHIGVLAFAEEIDMGVLQEIAGRGAVERDVLALGEAVVEDDPGDEDRGQDRGDDTDDEGRRESLDRAGTEDEEHDTGEDRGHLAVDDSGISVLVTVGDGLSETLSSGQFLFDALIDDHVRIHGHTQRQDETGDTREGKDCAEGDEGSEEEEHVAEKGDVSGDTGSPVEEDHVDEDEEESDQEGDHTRLDRTGTEGRTHDLLLDDLGRSREFTRLEDVGEVGRLFDGEIAGDAGIAAGDLVDDVRIGVDHAVEDDGDLLADVVLGQAGPDVGAFRVHGHGDAGGAAVDTLSVIGNTGVGDGTAVERGLAVTGGGLDSDEFINVAARYAVGRLDGPHRTEFGREDILDLRHGEVAVDDSGVGGLGETDAGVAPVAGRLENREERVLPAGLLEYGVVVCILAEFLGDQVVPGILLLRFCDLAFGGSFLAGEHLGEEVVGLEEILLDLLIGIGGPELEGCGALEEFADALRLLDTREFHEDAAAVAEFLDRRLGHAEAVDTVAEDVEGVGDGAFGIGADDRNDLVVGRGGVDAVAHFIGAEDAGEAGSVGGLLPRVGEKGDEILAGVDAALAGEFDGPVELRALVVACKGLDEVLELHLEHDVHAALEVKTEVDFLRFDVFVRVAEIHFLGRDGVEIAGVPRFCDGVEDISLVFGGYIPECGALAESLDGGVGILGGFLLLEAGHGREGKLPDARDSQKDSHKSDCTFTLHVSYFLKLIFGLWAATRNHDSIPRQNRVQIYDIFLRMKVSGRYLLSLHNGFYAKMVKFAN